MVLVEILVQQSLRKPLQLGKVNAMKIWRKNASRRFLLGEVTVWGCSKSVGLCGLRQ
jgi:hypothetical protein